MVEVFGSSAIFELGDVQTLIDHVFSLTYIRNTGAAWSILEGKMTFFTIITVAAVIVVTYLLIRHRKKQYMVSIGTILYLSRSDRKFYRSLAFGVRRGYVSARFYQFSDF